MKYRYLTFLLIFLLACESKETSNSKNAMINDTAPEWAQDAIWYQIFVERFRNGDTTNDPRPKDILGAYPGEVPAGWHVTNWAHDWYKADEWFDEVELPNFWDRLQLRRYGGDLQGVLDKIEYLHDLGITAIYFNPLNDSPSLHKYDPRNWRHIDRNFGPTPDQDEIIINSEIPNDPATWQFTNADKLFLKIIEECHKRNIKVIMDYSWNHTGYDFWALNDIRKNGKQSKFIDWYDIENFDNPQTPEDELKYKGWLEIKYLPELKKDIIGQDTIFPFEGNLHSETARQHIFNVAKRWLDPNGDGNLTDGVDGFRLDVAAEIPKDFWRQFRHIVRNINKDALLVGEIWWQEWPDKLMEPHQFLEGNMFDAIMNYRWYREARSFFADIEPTKNAREFSQILNQLLDGIKTDNNLAMMNLTASHDAPRTSTSLYNKNKYKFMTKPYENPDYKINKPDSAALKIQKLLLIHQYTYIGAPHIYYGDEVGMWGADDPDTRKPMLWDDIVYEPETAMPNGSTRTADLVQPDLELKNFYKKLIEIRKNYKALRSGAIEYQFPAENNKILVYKRQLDNPEDAVYVIFNKATQQINFSINIETGNWLSLLENSKICTSQNNKMQLTLLPNSAIILTRK